MNVTLGMNHHRAKFLSISGPIKPKSKLSASKIQW